MTTKAACLILISLSMTILTCREQTQTATPQPSPSPAATPRPSVSPIIGKPYSGSGTLKIVNVREGWVEIDHGEIKDFMPPMVMEYWVKDRSLLKSFRVGDAVDFTVVETGKGEYVTALRKKTSQ